MHFEGRKKAFFSNSYTLKSNNILKFGKLKKIKKPSLQTEFLIQQTTYLLVSY